MPDYNKTCVSIKDMAFHSKMVRGWNSISLRWLCCLKLKHVSALPTYCIWHFLNSKRSLRKSLLQSIYIYIYIYIYIKREKQTQTQTERHRETQREIELTSLYIERERESRERERERSATKFGIQEFGDSQTLLADILVTQNGRLW